MQSVQPVRRASRSVLKVIPIRHGTVHNGILQCQDTALALRLVTNTTTTPSIYIPSWAGGHRSHLGEARSTLEVDR